MKWVIEPRLLAVPGVANVSTYGQLEKEYQVLVRPADLRAYGVTLEQVKQAARQAAVYGSAGYHDTPNQRLAVQFATRVELGQEEIPSAPGMQRFSFRASIQGEVSLEASGEKPIAPKVRCCMGRQH
jgi:multidrug efflux pump subunit AcrB